MHSSKQVQIAVDEVCREQGGAVYDGESKDPIPSHNHAPEFSGHGSAEAPGVKGDLYPGGGGGRESAPGTGR